MLYNMSYLSPGLVQCEPAPSQASCYISKPVTLEEACPNNG